MKRLKAKGVEIIVYEPAYKEETFFKSRVERDLKKFEEECKVPEQKGAGTLWYGGFSQHFSGTFLLSYLAKDFPFMKLNREGW